ncbi:MAG: endonuclease/exonuclease/phosphatase family protein [Lachnospiraceae bacterium]|nr:endonuclease/exonuclease/phosphatase family protein [Lachnospiraceae bacterium]
MKIVSFNLRRDFEHDGDNRFNKRTDIIKSVIEKNHPDVIGFQEVLPEALAWLKSSLSGYTVVGTGRDDDLGDEATAVAFDTDKYDLIQMDTFWLSPTPEKPGSRYEGQSDCPRTCTMVLLKDVSTKAVFRVYNTHLDHIGSEARLHGAKQIAARIPEEKLFNGVPLVVMGDFNAFPQDPEVRFFSEKAGLTDFTESIGGTFHDFGELSTPEKIDYIFASKEWTLKAAGLWDEKVNGRFISDHFPVFVEMYNK